MVEYINNKKNKLNKLYKQIKSLRNFINNMRQPRDWQEELDMDEHCLYLESINIEINELEKFLNSIKNTQKFKNELIITSNKMLYNPTRVSKLLDQNLLSLNDSFAEL